MKYSAALLQFPGSKTISEAGVEGGPKADGASGLRDLGTAVRGEPPLVLRHGPTRPGLLPAQGLCLSPLVCSRHRGVSAASRERLSRPHVLRAPWTTTATPAQGSAPDTGVVPSLVGLGRGGLEQRSPQAAEPCGSAAPAQRRDRSVAAAPTPGRSARPAAGGHARITQSAPPECQKSRPFIPSDQSALPRGSVPPSAPLPCGSYKRDALETPGSARDWRRLPPIALRSGCAGDL